MCVQSDFQNHTDDDAIKIDIAASPKDTHAQQSSLEKQSSSLIHPSSDDTFSNVGAARITQPAVESPHGSGSRINPEHFSDTRDMPNPEAPLVRPRTADGFVVPRNLPSGSSNRVVTLYNSIFLVNHFVTLLSYTKM